MTIPARPVRDGANLLAPVVVDLRAASVVGLVPEDHDRPSRIRSRCSDVRHGVCRWRLLRPAANDPAAGNVCRAAPGREGASVSLPGWWWRGVLRHHGGRKLGRMKRAILPAVPSAVAIWPAAGSQRWRCRSPPASSPCAVFEPVSGLIDGRRRSPAVVRTLPRKRPGLGPGHASAAVSGRYGA